jgi:hypothetical protein
MPSEEKTETPSETCCITEMLSELMLNSDVKHAVISSHAILRRTVY